MGSSAHNWPSVILHANSRGRGPLKALVSTKLQAVQPLSIANASCLLLAQVGFTALPNLHFASQSGPQQERTTETRTGQASVRQESRGKPQGNVIQQVDRLGSAYTPQAFAIRNRPYVPGRLHSVEGTPSLSSTNDQTPRPRGERPTSGLTEHDSARERARSQSHSSPQQLAGARSPRQQALVNSARNHTAASAMVPENRDNGEQNRRRYQSMPIDLALLKRSDRFRALQDAYASSVQQVIQQGEGAEPYIALMLNKMKQMFDQFKVDLKDDLRAEINVASASAQAPVVAASYTPSNARLEQKRRDYPEVDLNVRQWQPHPDRTLVTIGKLMNSYQRHFQAPYAFCRGGVLKKDFEYLRKKRDADGHKWSDADYRRLHNSKEPKRPTFAELRAAGNRVGDLIA